MESAVIGLLDLSMPRESFMPQQQQQEDLAYQQYRAPPHYQSVRLANRWFERRATTEWPSRSPVLTATNFLLWGLCKTTSTFSPAADENTRADDTDPVDLCKKQSRNFSKRVEGGCMSA